MASEAIQKTGGDAVLQLLGQAQSRLRDILPRTLDEARFVRICAGAFGRTPKLWEAMKNPEGRQSILLAVMDAARLGLEPDGTQGALVPYKGLVKFLPMVSGLIELAWAGSQTTLDVVAVHEADHFKYRLGTNPGIEHEPVLDDPGELIAAYAVAHTPGAAKPRFEVMSKAQIDRVRGRSRASDDGPWVTDYEEMAKKTVARRLLKMTPKSPQLRAALEQDVALEREPLAAVEDVSLMGASPEPTSGVAGLKAKLKAARASPEAAPAEELSTEGSPAVEEPKPRESLESMGKRLEELAAAKEEGRKADLTKRVGKDAAAGEREPGEDE
jgi:recombination protein RecT